MLTTTLKMGGVKDYLWVEMPMKMVMINLKFSIPKCYNTHINNINQSITHLFYIKWHICQGDLFRPSRSSSGPPRKQIQELFSLGSVSLEGLRITD